MAKKNEIYKKLYRSETNRVLAGVAGGLGEYFGIDPLLLRILFILLAVFGGGGVIIYLILWLLIPSEKDTARDPEDTIKQNAEELKMKAQSFAKEFKGMQSENHSRNRFGFLIIVIGLVFLFDNLGFFRFHFFWPVLLIAFGLFLVFRNK